MSGARGHLQLAPGRVGRSEVGERTLPLQPGRNSLIVAGSVVTRSIPNHMVAAGNPAPAPQADHLDHPDHAGLPDKAVRRELEAFWARPGTVPGTPASEQGSGKSC